MTGVTREATPDCCGKEVYFVFLVMIVLFIVLSRNKLRTFRGYVLLGERGDKISGLYPSCGLTTEPLLSEPLWALLLDAPYMNASSPTLNHSYSEGLAVHR